MGLGKVPDSYILDGQMNLDCSVEPQQITVYAGDKHLVELETKRPCARLRYGKDRCITVKPRI